MEFNSISDDKKATVLEKLKLLNSTDRILLLSKYSWQTENVYCTFGVERNIEIITKIFMFKFNKHALFDADKLEKCKSMQIKKAEIEDAPAFCHN
jgi:hypothetical protein